MPAPNSVPEAAAAICAAMWPSGKDPKKNLYLTDPGFRDEFERAALVALHWASNPVTAPGSLHDAATALCWEKQGGGRANAYLDEPAFRDEYLRGALLARSWMDHGVVGWLLDQAEALWLGLMPWRH